MTKKSRLFLAASFFSAFGDTLLVFAVPSGLGIETEDIRSAVLMWLIPAIAIFASTFLSKRVARRQKDARVDYGKLLLTLGGLEIVVALLSLLVTSKPQILILICVFVFIYAFAKEGIPRLLYTVSVYRYFVSDQDFSKIAGSNAALNIGAGLLGTLLAAALITWQHWKLALILDSSTFLVLGYVILIHGVDNLAPISPAEFKQPFSQESRQSVLTFAQRSILFAVPLFFGLNALVWNYLPLLAERMGATTVVTSLWLIALLRLPGMLAGFRSESLSRMLSKRALILILPILTILMTVLFTLAPSTLSISALVLIQGLVAGLYWPADFSLRNTIDGDQLIKFNTMVVRRLALVQLAACLLALYIYQPAVELRTLLPLSIAVVIGLSILSTFSFEKAR